MSNGTGPASASSTPRLTSLSHGAGCACKLSLDELKAVLDGIPRERHPQAVVGHETGDDAGVWRGADGRLQIATTDFFTPVVDDARVWGRIAATNAVSDVYAMGGRPTFALNLVGWPRDLPFEILGEVLAGAQDVASEAGYAILGGHSIDSLEPLFGQAVFGEADASSLLTNAGARPGDALVLTKPIGTGLVMTATKRSDGPAEDVTGYAEAIASMTRLNARAAQEAIAAGAGAATDVTGFGLLGHLHRLCEASGSAAEIDAPHVPLLPGVLDLIADGLVPGGTIRNAEQAARYLAGDEDGWPDERGRLVLCDAQTSGGLLIALPEGRADDLVASLASDGHRAARIGTVTTGDRGAVRVIGSVA